MPSTQWQKSSYCADSSNCLNVAAFPDHTVRIRESAAPHAEVTTTRPQLGLLIAAVKGDTLAPDA
ncbi:hypothetical protein OEIGOIKO_04435 [Streptomyces chrestomyceticus JCM 4735]|uniref:DUF397 domain-containing protein n=1 Tax=Streptomyces chrestomyceticus JCM 4735 TaxID=1306181 RepID=A0A7U9KWG0_9ACTN|nr:hypothetical protein OEIGOIKO_04435 [Streptomyces chrestomyceticus JCM 4735]